MITLAICWKAIGIVILTFAGAIGLIALVDWITDLSYSHAKLMRIVGRSLLALTVLGLLIALYFTLSVTMCG